MVVLARQLLFPAGGSVLAAGDIGDYVSVFGRDEDLGVYQ